MDRRDAHAKGPRGKQGFTLRGGERGRGCGVS
jgi:hypothetical protein